MPLPAFEAQGFPFTQEFYSVIEPSCGRSASPFPYEPRPDPVRASVMEKTARERDAHGGFPLFRRGRCHGSLSFFTQRGGGAKKPIGRVFSLSEDIRFF